MNSISATSKSRHFSDPKPMSFYSSLNHLHAAMGVDDFLDKLEDVLLSIQYGRQFALIIHDKNTGKLNIAQQRGFDRTELYAAIDLLGINFPVNELKTRDDLANKSIVVGNLSFDGKTYGLMLIEASNGNRSKLDRKKIHAVYQAVGIALVKLQILEEANKNSLVAIEKNNAINHVADVLQNMELDTLLASLLDVSLGIMKAQVGTILLEESDGSLIGHCEMGLPADFLLSLKDRQGQSFVQQVMAKSESTLIQNASNDDRIDLTNCEQHIQSILCVPLSIKAKCLGLLVIINAKDCFDQSGYEVLCTIAYLAASAIENALLRIEQITSNRIRQQIFLARQIQESLQAKYIPQRDEVELDGWCLSCDETGGDYYDFLEVGANKVGLIVGDASGHGLGAALMMIAVRASLLSLMAQDYPLTDVFQLVGNRIEADGHTDRFMTLFCGFLDLDRKTLSYCSAGHDSPLLYRPSEDTMIELEATGIPLGMFTDWQYELKETERLHSGDILLISTDGVREAFNENQEAFGDERLQNIIRAGIGLSAQEISIKLRESLLDFIGSSPRTDDITVMVAVIK